LAASVVGAKIGKHFVIGADVGRNAIRLRRARRGIILAPKQPKAGSHMNSSKSTSERDRKARSVTPLGPSANPGLADNPAKPHRMQFITRLRNYFLAGILVTAPIGITFYLAWQFIHFVDSRVTPIIPAKYNPETYLPFSIPGLGLIVVVVGLILIGALTAGFMGRMFVHTSERVVERMPVIRNVYGAVKQITEAVFAKKAEALRQVVLFEYPRKGLWALGFTTGITEGEVQDRTGAEVVNVFLPTTPNPTSGYLLFVPRKDLVVLSMTVEEGIKMVVSGGIVTPPVPRRVEKQPVTLLQADEGEAPAMAGRGEVKKGGAG
jgi:uncharacterized membrane protein